jgi:hypothetical protein
MLLFIWGDDDGTDHKWLESGMGPGCTWRRFGSLNVTILLLTGEFLWARRLFLELLGDVRTKTFVERSARGVLCDGVWRCNTLLAVHRVLARMLSGD